MMIPSRHERLRSRGSSHYSALAGVSADLVARHPHPCRPQRGRGPSKAIPRCSSPPPAPRVPVGEVQGSRSNTLAGGMLAGEHDLRVHPRRSFGICPSEDLGQAEHRAEQRTAIGEVASSSFPIGGVRRSRRARRLQDRPAAGACGGGRPCTTVPRQSTSSSRPTSFLEAFAANAWNGSFPDSGVLAPQDGKAALGSHPVRRAEPRLLPAGLAQSSRCQGVRCRRASAVTLRIVKLGSGRSESSSEYRRPSRLSPCERPGPCIFTIGSDREGHRPPRSRVPCQGRRFSGSADPRACRVRRVAYNFRITEI